MIYNSRHDGKEKTVMSRFFWKIRDFLWMKMLCDNLSYFYSKAKYKDINYFSRYETVFFNIHNFKFIKSNNNDNI